MDSIITQVNREDEQLNAFANDKGKERKEATKFAIFVQIFVLMKKKVFLVLHYPGLPTALKNQIHMYNITLLL
jgi:hypothetical protein